MFLKNNVQTVVEIRVQIILHINRQVDLHQEKVFARAAFFDESNRNLAKIKNALFCSQSRNDHHPVHPTSNSKMNYKQLTLFVHHVTFTFVNKLH
ncbi:hypothetical protein AC249_AIPGENE14036 [Exaiptasia diaphana]|nr:hypothetical protein AC249_AIPGENE14036 [Exaiptasia diaphana]